MVNSIRDEIETDDYQKELIGRTKGIACSISARYMSLMIDVRVSWAFARDAIFSLSACSTRSGIIIDRWVYAFESKLF